MALPGLGLAQKGGSHRRLTPKHLNYPGSNKNKNHHAVLSRREKRPGGGRKNEPAVVIDRGVGRERRSRFPSKRRPGRTGSSHRTLMGSALKASSAALCRGTRRPKPRPTSPRDRQLCHKGSQVVQDKKRQRRLGTRQGKRCRGYGRGDQLRLAHRNWRACHGQK